ncbi:hypothetical protein [Pseudomonas rhizoryzae]|uniref:hypothetical protein n=1 Tax=Pseudomonas rhizoryzae TaxID=2571129 RepID=UPI001F01ACE4|nr:hypothetical protein [Pseudomonas rhizoryzae]
MKTIRLTVAALALAALGGCVAVQPQARSLFPAAEYSYLPKTGTGSVRGQVFMRTVGGDVKYGAGSNVELTPVTSYTEEWYNASFVRKVPIAAPDSRLLSYIRNKRADGTGSFKFTDLPPGEYFVVSEVRWQAPTQFGLAPQGGFIATRVTVENDKESEVIVTQ